MSRTAQIVGAGIASTTAIAIMLFGGTRSAPAAQTPVTITLPAPNATFRPGPGLAIVQRDCLTCHSSEYVTSQPPLSKNTWTKEIVKMRAAYGASIPEADTDAIVAYLVAQNPSPTK